MNFRENAKPRSSEKNEKKKLFFKTCIIFLKVEKKLLMLLKAKLFTIKSKRAGILNPDHSKFKVLTPKQML